MLRSIARPLFIFGIALVAYVTAPTAAAGDEAAARCNEWIPCSGDPDYCDDAPLGEAVCNLMCPGWIAALCTEDSIMCVSEPE